MAISDTYREESSASGKEVKFLLGSLDQSAIRQSYLDVRQYRIHIVRPPVTEVNAWFMHERA